MALFAVKAELLLRPAEVGSYREVKPMSFATCRSCVRDQRKAGFTTVFAR
jgi:hypothetical protein